MDNKQINTNQFSGMNKDINQSLLKNNVVTHARNATIDSVQGDMILYQTESSPKFCCEFPYTPIGHELLPDNTYVIFLTDDVNSEIGIFSEKTCTYTKKFSASWLNFNRNSLITAQTKENNDGSYSVYWSDAKRNPDRTINLSKLSSATEDNTLLTKLITPPVINFRQSNNGVLPDGTYQVAIAYSINKVKYSDYYITIPKPIIDKRGSAIEITVEANDIDFDEYEVVIIQSKESTSIAKRVGYYPRKTRNITVSNFDRPEYSVIQLSDLVVTNTPIIASDQIDGNNQYLFRIGTESVPEIDHQLKCMNVEMEYVIWQVPEDYYKEGDKVGYYRDEVYSFYRQLLHKTGYWSSEFHLPGRKATSSELANAQGQDNYEASITHCDPITPRKRWQVENTASLPKLTGNTRTDECKEIEVGYGKMGYYESTDTYPNNPIQYGDQAGKPILLPRFPDECKAPRYSVIDGKNYINILGVRFKNLPDPEDPNWVGYRIIRADREGNRSVISRGLFTNMRSYTDNQNDIPKEVFYSNYGVNSLSPDPYLSSTQTVYKNKKENNYTPLSTFHKDKFTFYSPHNNIGRYSPTTEVKFETEEIADVQGNFEITQGHPKLTLLTQFSFWLTIAIAALETSMEAAGALSKETGREIDKSVPPSVKHSSFIKPNSFLASIGTSVSQAITSVLAGDLQGFKLILQIITLIANLAILPVLFTLTAMKYATELLDIIYNFIDPTDYAYQYNSKAFFNKQKCITTGNKRRYVKSSNYLLNGIQEVDGLTFNNFNRADTIYINTNSEIQQPETKDTSLVQYSDGVVSSQGVGYYGTLKVNNPNQYGRIETTFQNILCHNNTLPLQSTSPIIFGGDCWINRFSIKNPFLFFTQDLAFPETKENIGYNYRLYRNVAYPRYWLDSFKYDFSSLLNKTVINRARFTRTTDAKYNLFGVQNDSDNKFRVDAKMFTSYNTVLEFFVESDYNLEAREKPKDDSTYYKKDKSTNLSDIFNPKKLKIPEQFVYDKSFSKLADQIAAQPQRDDYNPAIYSTVYQYSKNRFAYSLPAYQEQSFDNWLYFLNNNGYEFPRSEYGTLTSVMRIDGERLMFLFDGSSPYVLLGRQQLETKDGTAIQIGDGGLFAQPPKETIYTEQNFGNSQSKFGHVSTNFGPFYIGERQGRLLQFSDIPKDITENGIYYWAKTYFPIKLKEYFPTFSNMDNPVTGCGYLMGYDATKRIIYVIKKDYVPKYKEIKWDETKKSFYYNSLRIELSDINYFEESSFTLSYSPLLQQFISYHDWHPEWIIAAERNLVSIKDNKAYIHNIDCQDYCTYYGVKRPFEIEYVDSNKFRTAVLTNIFYYQETFKYYEDCINKYLSQENFTHMIIYNNNQTSGLLKITKYPDNPYLAYEYPKQTALGYEVLCENVENEFRINQIQDIYAKNNLAPVIEKSNGYDLIVNPAAHDFKQNPLEAEDFRHYDTRIRLINDNPQGKMIIKITAQQNLNSPN